MAPAAPPAAHTDAELVALLKAATAGLAGPDAGTAAATLMLAAQRAPETEAADAALATTVAPLVELLSGSDACAARNSAAALACVLQAGRPGGAVAAAAVDAGAAAASVATATAATTPADALNAASLLAALFNAGDASAAAAAAAGAPAATLALLSQAGSPDAAEGAADAACAAAAARGGCLDALLAGGGVRAVGSALAATPADAASDDARVRLLMASSMLVSAGGPSAQLTFIGTPGVVAALVDAAHPAAADSDARAVAVGLFQGLVAAHRDAVDKALGAAG